MGEVKWLTTEIHSQNVKMYNKIENHSKRIITCQLDKRVSDESVSVERSEWIEHIAWRLDNKAEIKRKNIKY